MEHLDMVVDGVCICDACIDERASKLWLVMAHSSELGDADYLYGTADTEELANALARKASLVTNARYVSVEGAHHKAGCWDVTVFVNGTEYPYLGKPICARR